MLWAGCCCCEYADRFNRADNADIGPNWDVRSGGWSIDGNKLKVNSSGMVIWSIPSDRADDGIHSANAIVTIPSPAISSVDIRYRVIVRYLDDDNYLAGEILITAASIGTGYNTWTNLGYYSIVERIAGSETITRGPRTAYVTGGSGLLMATFREAVGGSPATLTIAGGATADGGYAASSRAITWHREVTDPGGTKGGLAVMDGGPLTFDDWCYARHVNENAGHRTCFDIAPHGCGNQTAGTHISRYSYGEAFSQTASGINLFHRTHNRGEGSYVFASFDNIGRIYWDYLDENNHHYAKFQSDGVSVMTIEAHRVTSGSDSTLASSTGPVTIPGGPYECRVCVQGDTITVRHYDDATGPPPTTYLTTTSTPHGGWYEGWKGTIGIGDGFFTGLDAGSVYDSGGCRSCA